MDCWRRYVPSNRRVRDYNNTVEMVEFAEKRSKLNMDTRIRYLLQICHDMLFHSSFKKQKAIGLIAQWTDSLHYPEDKSFLRDIMMDKRLPDSITEAAAKIIPASDESQLVKEIVCTGQDGAARVFLDHMDCFRLPEDKDILLHMLECKDFRRIKAAEILAKDKTMQNYKICPYCGRSADKISYSYKGLYNDMYYYSWRCKCGHEYSAPEGYGDGFAVTIAEYVRDPDRFH